MNDLQRLLDMAVRWDAATVRKAREILDGRLRELGELPELPVNVKATLMSEDEFNERWLAKPMTADEYREATAGDLDWPHTNEQLAAAQQDGSWRVDPLGKHEPWCDTPRGPCHSTLQRREGLELQAGLEEALRRDQDSTE